MKVEDLMTAAPEKIDVTASVSEAFNRLFELDVRHLPVVDENDELIGMLSDRDLRSYSLPLMNNFENADTYNERGDAPVSDIMQGDVMSVDPAEEITEVIRLMIDHKIGALPVVDPIRGNLVGIISYIDILREAEDLFDGV
jgi:acetoin utilization protein AcuB